MADKQFVHLHVHSEYSLLDGLTTIPLAIKRAGELNMPALAITDHGNMYGAVSFYDAICKYNKGAKENGKNTIKAIFGTEFYVCDDMTVKTRTSDIDGRDRRHLLLLVKNEIGYKNISYLNAVAFRDGYYYKPRIDLKTLREHSEGLICLSACIAGDIPQAIIRGDYEKAKSLILWFKEVFGEDFYLEMQNHGIEEELLVNQYLRKYSKELGVKLVVTNDVHYVNKEDAVPHDVLLCVQTGKMYNDPNRMKFSSDDFYLKSYDEMLSLFPDDEEALLNSLEVAEKCNFEFTYGHYMFPRYVPDTKEDPVVYIRKLIDEGVKKKYGSETPEIRERIETELSVIEKQGFIEYFLIVWDYINEARKMGISVGPGRGSGAGSIVAYLIGITDIDPLKYDLYFERFLNSERVSAPDFDVDFEDCRRDEVIEYVRRKYGEDRVCRIVTFGTMAAKNAIKDVGRVLGVSYSECDAITKIIPKKQTKFGVSVDIGRPNVLQKIFGFYKPSKKEEEQGLTTEHFAVDELVQMYKENENIKRVADIAMRLEDTPRQCGVHACGVIIGQDVLDKHMPLSRSVEEEMTSQYTGPELEHLGFLKMDFLGLSNLSDIKNCIEYVKENHGVEIDFSKSKYDDPKVFELISSGNTDAIFQLESGGFKKFLKELRPNCLEDIVAAVSLFRPGPMDSIPTFVKNKHQGNVTYLHPLLKPILEQTYGCIVYQEQVMRIVQTLAGYTLGQADMIRRMMGKKQVAAMEKEETVFIYGKEETTDSHGKVSKAIDGCVKRGVPEDVAKTIWSQMKDFAKYAFNKSHAAAYSFVTYQTAYLKCYYEPEFLTAVLNNRITKTDDLKKYVNYVKSENIEILSPSINESEAHFTVKNGKIRFGLAAIKNIGVSIIEHISEERKLNGKFTSFENFINRTAQFNLNKRMIENLIYSGALDEFGRTRSQLIAVYSDYLDRVVSGNKNKNEMQISMFDEILKEEDVNKIDWPNVPEFNSKEKLLKEKEVMGIYLSGHPLSDYMEDLKKFDFSTKQLLSYEEVDETDEEGGEIIYTDVHDGEHVTMGGIVSEYKTISTKKGQSMAFVTVEDVYGQVEVIIFPKVYEKARPALNDEEIVKVSGKIQIKGNVVQIIADDFEKLEVKGETTQVTGGENLGLIIAERNENNLDAILDILGSYPGDIPVIIARSDGRKFKVNTSVRRSPGLIAELKGFLEDKEIIFFIKKS